MVHILGISYDSHVLTTIGSNVCHVTGVDNDKNYLCLENRTKINIIRLFFKIYVSIWS